MLNTPNQPTVPIMPNLTHGLFFKGTCTKFPKPEESGAIVFCDGTSYICAENEWTKIDAIDKLSEPLMPKPTHCPSCGAPLDRHKDRCEYCGTEWR